MIARVWRVFQCECSRWLRRPVAYAGPFVVLVTVLAITLARYGGDAPLSYSHIADAASAALNLGGLALAIAFGALLVAPEVQSGTIRLLLVRPATRLELLLGKFLLGLTHILLMLAVAYAAAWAVVAILGELTGVTLGGTIVYTQREMRTAFLYGALLSILPMAAATAYALLISVIARSGSAAVLLALAGWLILDVVKHPLGIEAVVFTSYVETPMRLFSQRAHGLEGMWTPDIYFAVGVSLATLLVCLAASAFLFHRKALRG